MLQEWISCSSEPGVCWEVLCLGNWFLHHLLSIITQDLGRGGGCASVNCTWGQAGQQVHICYPQVIRREGGQEGINLVPKPQKVLLIWESSLRALLILMGMRILILTGMLGHGTLYLHLGYPDGNKWCEHPSTSPYFCHSRNFKSITDHVHELLINHITIPL